LFPAFQVGLIVSRVLIHRQQKQAKFELQVFGIMDDEFLPDYIRANYKVYDRFTFDYLFKRLLADGCDHEEAKDTILCNCALSTLVMQERIYNEYYLDISETDTMANDLLELRSEIFKKALENEN
jgi:hypothetical protein